MKILLIYDSEDTPAAGRIQSLLKEMNLPVWNFPVRLMDSKAEDTVKAIGAFLEPPDSVEREGLPAKLSSRVLITASLPEKWLDFLAGYSTGSRLPFLVYGEEAVTAVPEEFTFCFVPFRTEAALKQYFEAEAENARKNEAAQTALIAREELLRKGVPVCEESLARSVFEGSVEDVSLFFAAGYSPNTRDKAGVPLLNLSARKGDREMLRLLLGAGADVDLYAIDRGSSALLDSAMGKHHNLASDLLEAGADVNIRSKDGQSALIVAVGAGDEKMTELLLKAGADPDIPDSLGASARKYATLFHQKAMMSLFETYAPAQEA